MKEPFGFHINTSTVIPQRFLNFRPNINLGLTLTFCFRNLLESVYPFFLEWYSLIIRYTRDSTAEDNSPHENQVAPNGPFYRIPYSYGTLVRYTRDTSANG